MELCSQQLSVMDAMTEPFGRTPHALRNGCADKAARARRACAARAVWAGHAKRNS